MPSDPILIQTQVTNPTCGYNNGTILITASGGTAPYTFSLNGSIQNNGYFPGINASGSGVYSIIVTDATGQSAAGQVILVNTSPPPDFIVTSVVRPTTCTSNDGSVTLVGTAGIPPYEYSIDGVNFSANNKFSNLTRGTYYFFIKDANGCIRQKGFGFLGEFECINPCGLVCNGEGGLTACNLDGTINIVAFGGRPPYLYSIDGISFQTSRYPHSSEEFNNLPSGLYHLYVKDSDSTLVVSGYQLIQSCDVAITYVGVDASCGQSDGSITIHAVHGNPPFLYSIDGINFQTDSSFVGLSSGNYSVSVRDAIGIITSRSVTVYNKCPVVTAVATDDTCAQAKGSIIAFASKGTPPYTYSIDGINFQANNVFNSLSANTYTVTLKDVNGFVNTTSVVVKNNCLQLSVTIKNPTCGLNNGTVFVSGSDGVAPYAYSIDGLNFQSGNQFANLSPGRYVITIRDANSLTAAKDTQLYNIPGPQMQVFTTPASCQNAGGSLRLEPIGGTWPFLFSIDNGLHLVHDSVFSNLDSAVYFPLIKDSNGCIIVDTIQLTALPTPHVFLGNDTSFCVGQTFLVSANLSAGYTYQWQDNSTNYNYLVTATGSYWVRVTNQYGCYADDTISVQFMPVPSFQLGADTSLCNGQVLHLNPTLPPGNYLWSTGNNSSTVNVSSAGLYWLQVSNNGCAFRDSITVFYKPLPNIHLGNDTTLCDGNRLLLDVTVSNGIYKWQDGSVQPIYTISKPGNYIVKVSQNGCDTTGKINVTYMSTPVVNLVKDTTLCYSNSLLLNAYFPHSSFKWQDGSTGSSYRVDKPGLFSVEVSNFCGTKNYSSIVKFENCQCTPFVPNAFTPNHSTNNDVFRIKFKCQISGYKLTVYNRWGQIVFSSHDPSMGWDGNSHTTMQPAGTYVWLLEYIDLTTGKLMYNNGTVILIR